MDESRFSPHDLAASLVQHAPVGLVGATADGTVLLWNGGAQRLLGWTPKEAEGRRLDDLLGAHARDEVRTQLQRATQGEFPSFQCRCARREGDSFRAIISIAAVPNGGAPEVLAVSIVKPPTDAIDAGDAARLQRLTPRQREVLQHIAVGRSTKDIARQLGLSVKTVETHRAQLMKRLGIFEVAGLVRYAIRAGVVGLD